MPTDRTRLGNWQAAMDLSKDSFRKSLKTQALLCATWDRLEMETVANSDRATTFEELGDFVSCPQP